MVRSFEIDSITHEDELSQFVLGMESTRRTTRE